MSPEAYLPGVSSAQDENSRQMERYAYPAVAASVHFGR